GHVARDALGAGALIGRVLRLADEDLRAALVHRQARGLEGPFDLDAGLDDGHVADASAAAAKAATAGGVVAQRTGTVDEGHHHVAAASLHLDGSGDHLQDLLLAVGAIAVGDVQPFAAADLLAALLHAIDEDHHRGRILRAARIQADVDVVFLGDVDAVFTVGREDMREAHAGAAAAGIAARAQRIGGGPA